MLILTIETSCDETSVAIGEIRNSKVKLLSHVVSSQIKLHAKWGGVVPTLAAREHLKNLAPVMNLALEEAGFRKPADLAKKVDLIGVTQGPGLIPALLMGVNFAKSLSYIWKKPLIPVNHMEAHLYTSWIEAKPRIQEVRSRPRSFSFRENPFPMLALLVSGGHTMLVLVKDHLRYKLLGETLDDAVGEAFDKVARILGLGYPGGPMVSKLAQGGKPDFAFSLPLRDSRELNFSFSGLKTAVLYKALKLTQKKKTKDILNIPPKPDLDIPLTTSQKRNLAKAFEDCAISSLMERTKMALARYPVKTLVLGGGVAANRVLRSRWVTEIKQEFPRVEILLPPINLTGDNAAMLIPVTYIKWQKANNKQREKFRNNWATLEADSNLSLGL